MSQPHTPEQVESTDSQESVQEVPITSRQRLAPLLALCVVMMAIGAYFALGTSREASTDGSHEAMQAFMSSTMVPIHDADELEEVTSPVMLSYRSELEPTLAYVMTQRNVMSSGDEVDVPGLQTTFGFEMKRGFGEVSKPAKEFAGKSTHHVSFLSALLTIEEPGKPGEPIGAAISEQFSRQLKLAGLDMTRQQSGAYQDFIWTSRVNAQVKPAMKLVEGAISMLSPVLPMHEVSHGETWSYIVELPGVEVEGKSYKGEIKVDNTLEGVQRTSDTTLYKISQVMRVTGSGETGDHTYAMSGEGKGVAWFDGSEMSRQGMTLETTLTLTPKSGKDVVTRRSDYTLSMRSATAPEVGEQQNQ